MSKNFKHLLKTLSVIVLVMVGVILILPMWYQVDTAELWKVVATLVGAGLVGTVISSLVKA